MANLSLSPIANKFAAVAIHSLNDCRRWRACRLPAEHSDSPRTAPALLLIARSSCTRVRSFQPDSCHTKHSLNANVNKGCGQNWSSWICRVVLDVVTRNKRLPHVMRVRSATELNAQRTARADSLRFVANGLGTSPVGLTWG